MALTSAVHWWEESQLRVLVLGSLVVQFVLFIFTFLRRSAIPGWIRFVMWFAYLGGDAIAIYALATLFNRHKEDQGGGGGSSTRLEVVWAPILLIHLGGHDGITAYNIEDNELWTRHLLTAVSQVTVAIYVFCKSWPPGGDKQLLQAAIVLFVPGVLKCFAKPWALKSASIKSLVSSPAARSTKKQKEDITRLEEYVQRRAKASVREQKDEGKQNEGEMDAFERYLEGAMAFVREQQKDEGEGAQVYPTAPVEDSDGLPSQQGNDISSSQHHRQVKEKEIDLNMILNGEAYKLFVDLSSPYPLRLSIFKCFWALSEETVEKAYGSVRQGLASAFILLYTKMKFSGFFITSIVKDMRKPTNHMKWSVGLRTPPVSLKKKNHTKIVENTNIDEAMRSFFGLFVTASRFYLPWAAIGLFHHSHREVYSGIDVKITYALFCCTAVLELISHTIFSLKENDKEQWPEMVAQYNLIGYYARNKKHHKKMWIASKSGCKDLLDQHWCMRSCFSSGPITELVLEYLKAGWKEKIHDPVSYNKFNDNRGQWALESYQHKLGWSIKAPFDESVLTWHIATGFCFFLSLCGEHIQVCDFAKVPPALRILLGGSVFVRERVPARTDKNQCTQGSPQCRAVQCRQMSNYMVYLLFVNPEMLLPGSRRNLFTTAYDELKDILGDNKPSLFAKLRDILKDNEQDVCLRVRTAMKELKGILTDKKQNSTSRSQWKHAPLTEEGIIEKVISSIRDKSTQASEGQESKEGSEDSESESEDGHIQELEEGGCKQMQDRSKKQDPEIGSQEESKEGQPKGGCNGNFIDDAWDLAQGLLKLRDDFGDEKMWDVIQGVWVEMLCFSASRCRGYLHAKALGSGGEFLSYVWLLRFYMGMETFSERLQREEIPSREANNSGAPPPSDADNGNATTSSSTSRIRSRAAPSPSHLDTGASPSNSEIRIAID